MPTEPEVTLPLEAMKKSAWEELNDRASQIRKIQRAHGASGVASIIAEEVVVVDTGKPANAPSKPEDTTA